MLVCVHTTNELLLHGLIYNRDLRKDRRRNGDSICHSSFPTENFQHVFRGSEKAGLDLLGSGTGKLALRTEFPIEELEVGSQVLFQIFNAAPSRSERTLSPQKRTVITWG